MTLSRERDRVIDVLKFIAIVCILVAHSSPNGIIFQLRNFDVILMVLLMGTSFYISNSNKKVKIKGYIIKRFSRLILSTWKFLILFFIVFYLISLALNESYYFGLKTIQWSFLLNGGIGFVWIMYVFFVVAIFSPFLFSLSEKINKNSHFFLLLVLAYLLYHLAVEVSGFLPTTLENLTVNYILVPLGYCIVAALGIRLKRLSKREIIGGAFLFFLVFVGLFVFHDYAGTQAYKYPPTLYYISYGLFVSLLMYFLLSYLPQTKLLFNSFVFFYSEKSLNLYFWHIIPFFILEIYVDSLTVISKHFISRFLFILCSALVLTYLHARVQKWWESRSFKNSQVSV